jgi:putative transposase
MRLRRPTRLEGFPYRGYYCYSLRFATHNRVHHFTRSELVAGALLQIQRTADEDSFAVVAYCFMPDHVHLAIEGMEPDSDLRRFVKVAKQRVAYIARREFQIPIRYILDNPVRAGLVEQAEAFPYSGTLFWPQA